MRMFKSLSLDKRNDILNFLYVHPLPLDVMEGGSSSDGAGLFSINMEQFSSQLLVAVNRLSSDESSIESVGCQLVFFKSIFLYL